MDNAPEFPIPTTDEYNEFILLCISEIKLHLKSARLKVHNNDWDSFEHHMRFAISWHKALMGGI